MIHTPPQRPAAMRNIQMRIKIEMIDTAAPVTIGKGLEAMDDGSFSVILGKDAQFDIDRLENGLLGISYQAMRSAMSAHLENVSKKKQMRS